MSLKVWLPLNGNLNNNGTSPSVVVNSGATVNPEGKTGNCYAFDGNDDYISITDSALYSIFKGGTQPFSIAMWVYHVDTSRAILFGDYGLSGSINFNIELYTDHKVRFYWNGNPDYNTTVNVGASTWTHVAITYDGSSLRSYANGSLINTRSGALAALSKTSGAFYLGRDSRTGTTALNGKLNDFRIYDYCLSVAEVHEIAQGLVCHYKLDLPNPNLLANSMPNINSLSGWSVAGTNWANNIVSNSFSPSGYVVRSTYSGTGQVSGGLHHPIADTSLVTNGATYTVSCWARASKNCSATFTNEWMTTSHSIGLTTNWQFYSYSCAVDTSRTYRSNVLYVPQADVVQNMWIECCNMKFEVGEKATPWCPYTSDALYNTLGYNMTTIEDCSGYGYHGTISGSIASESSSPRYDTCSHINATSQYIKCGSFPTSGFANSYSFAWWSKCDNWGNSMIWGFSDGIRLNGLYIGTLWNTGDGGDNPLYNPGTTTQVVAPTTGVWHHFVMIGDGTTCSVYKDGKLWATAKTYKAINGTQIYINGWDTTTSYKHSNLYMSDFRVYSTALSADDIKELYHVGLKIDNRSGMHTYELQEGQNQLLPTAQGLLQCGHLEEDEKASFFKDKHIEASRIIEM